MILKKHSGAPLTFKQTISIKC